MAVEKFQTQMGKITGAIVGEKLDISLTKKLNHMFPSDGLIFQDVKATCISAIEEGWMCNRGDDSLKFGRIIKDLDGFSIDVVLMNNVVGPHHRHPEGEIDMIMPLSDDAKFDGNGVGWLVYGPNSAHQPTVTDGKAIILYLLPDGAIEFTDI